MNKVTIKLQGGLGNYLFQIACAYAYALKYNKELYLVEEDSTVIHKPLASYKGNILQRVKFSKPENVPWRQYQEVGFHHNEIPFIGENVFLNGYFQSSKYFEDYFIEARNLFSYSIPRDGYWDFFSQNTCSIHVRRGDYLNSPDHHPTQSMNYYMKAIKQMPKDSVFLIFSDDIPWCRQNFPDIPEKFVFVEGKNDYEDLYLMKSCKNNIICNSSFSWWAAYLNENTNKIVIAPKLWFGKAYVHYNTKDIYCEGWNII